MVNVQVDFPPHLEARLQAKLRSEHLDRQTYLAGLIQRNLVRERERELFDSILHVCEIEGKGRHEAVGFDRAGSLVYCNGRTTKPITLKQSTQLVAKMSAAYSRNTDWLNENFDARTRVKWLRLVAAAVR